MHRDDRAAIIVVVLILAALVIVGSAQLLGRSAFEAWPIFEPRDTYAQWSMALLALVATVVSIVGVIWIRETLVATRSMAQAALDANRTTREIGEAQVRAYLTCIGADFVVNEKIVYINVAIKNAGQSPSLGGTIRASLVFPDMVSGNLVQIDSLTPSFVGAIAAGDQDTALVWFQEGTVREDLLYNAMHGALLISLTCHLTWRDVFNKGDHHLNFYLIEKAQEGQSVGGDRRGEMSVSQIRRATPS